LSGLATEGLELGQGNVHAKLPTLTDGPTSIWDMLGAKHRQSPQGLNGLATEGLEWGQGNWNAKVVTPMDGPILIRGLYDEKYR
jgi:hypothetical protein